MAHGDSVLTEQIGAFAAQTLQPKSLAAICKTSRFSLKLAASKQGIVF
jgi:hypothetical protein